MNFSGVALSHLCPKSMSYHFIRLSGLCGKTSVAREHRLLCKLIRLLHQYDQCDITNIAQCRCRTRHTIQLEAATRRNPWAPDSRDWTSSWDATVDEHGCAVIPEFATWVADLQRNEGKSQKAAREWREEQESLRKGADKDNKENG